MIEGFLLQLSSLASPFRERVIFANSRARFSSLFSVNNCM